MLIDISRLKEFLQELNMKPFSAHIEFDALETNLDDVVTGCKSLGCEYIVVPNLPRDRFRDAEGFMRGSKMLSMMGERVANSGLKFCYHNHAKEFERFGDKTAMELLFDGHQKYSAEIDVYWVQYGGGDPAQWIRKKGESPTSTHEG